MSDTTPPTSTKGKGPSTQPSEALDKTSELVVERLLNLKVDDQDYASTWEPACNALVDLVAETGDVGNMYSALASAIASRMTYLVQHGDRKVEMTVLFEWIGGNCVGLTTLEMAASVQIGDWKRQEYLDGVKELLHGIAEEGWNLLV